MKNLKVILIISFIISISGCSKMKISPASQNKILISRLDYLIKNSQNGEKYNYSLDENGAPYLKNQVMVYFKTPLNPSQQTAFAKLLKEVEKELGINATFQTNPSSPQLIMINIVPNDCSGKNEKSEPTMSAVARLQGDVLSAFPEMTVSRNYLTMNIEDTSTGNASNLELQQAPDNAVDGGDVVIGLIDSGVDYNDPCLKGYIWKNEALESGSDGYIDDFIGYAWEYETINTACGTSSALEPYNNPQDDTNRHGTIVAKVMVKNIKTLTSLSSQPPSTTMPKIRIMPLKAFDENGIGTLAAITAAISYGKSNGVKIFNCSFTFNNLSDNFDSIFTTNDAAFVCAAGNDCIDITDRNIVPAKLSISPNIITVTALNSNKELPILSNYSGSLVNVATLGEYDEKILCNQKSNDKTNGTFTSFATPVVSVGIAYLYGRNPTMQPDDFKEALNFQIINRSSPLSSLNNKVQGNKVFVIETFFGSFL